MSETPQLSESKRALIERYLRGDLPQPATAIPQDVEAETTGRRAGVVAIQAGGARRPFFYLHGDWRGNASYCYPLAQALGADQPFYGLAPYTFDGLRVPPPLETIARFHLESLRRIQPEGPYLLGGWCNGALVAYEVARQLHAQGQTVDLLLLVVPLLPGHHRLVRSVISRLVSLLRRGQEKQLDWFLIVQHVYRYLRFPQYRQLNKSKRMGTDEQSVRGDKSGKGRFGLPRFGALFTTAKALRQHYPNMIDWVNAGYAPSLYPGKITFFWMSEDPGFSVEWRKAVKAKEGEVEILSIPGNDITSRTEHLPALAEKLRDCINKVQEPALPTKRHVSGGQRR